MIENKGKDQCLAHKHSLMLAAIYSCYFQQSEGFSGLANLSSHDSRLCKGYYFLSTSVNSVTNCQQSQYSDCRSKRIVLNKHLHQPTHDVSRLVR